MLPEKPWVCRGRERRPDRADRGHLRHGGNGQDRARRPLRPPGRQALPRRPAVRQPARRWIRPPRRWNRARRCGSSSAPWACRRTGSRRAAEERSALFRSLLDGKRMLIVLDNAPRRGPGAPAAARLAGLPGRGDQPQRAGRAGGRGGSGAAHAGRAQLRRGPRDAGPQARPGPGRGRARGGGRDHRVLRPPPAGPGHRGRPRGQPARSARWPSWPPSCATPGAGWTRSQAGDAATNVRAVLSWSYDQLSPSPRRGCSACSACTRARTSRCPRRPAWPGWPGPRRAPRCAS